MQLWFWEVIYETFHILNLWFCSHLWKFKYTRQGNLADWNKMARYRMTATIIKDNFRE